MFGGGAVCTVTTVRQEGVKRASACFEKTPLNSSIFEQPLAPTPTDDAVSQL